MGQGSPAIGGGEFRFTMGFRGVSIMDSMNASASGPDPGAGSIERPLAGAGATAADRTAERVVPNPGSCAGFASRLRNHGHSLRVPVALWVVAALVLFATPVDEAAAQADRQVQIVSVTPGSVAGTLVVTWEALDPAPSDYKVQWKRSSDPGYVGDITSERCIAVLPPGFHLTSMTSYTITGLEAGTAYMVRVREDHGCLEGSIAPPGPSSAEITRIPLLPAPGQVMGEVRVTEEVESLTLSWDPVSNANGYKVQWKSGGQDYDLANRQAATTVTATEPGTSHTISGLDPGTEFTVRVFATKTNSFTGAYSREATGTPRLGQVMDVDIEEGEESLTVSWNPVNHANGYKVQWKSGDQGYDPANREAATTVTATNPGTSHTISGLDPGTEFTVRVFATKTNSFTGAYSREATGTPRLGQVMDVDIEEGEESLTVSWNPVNHANGYKVQWKSGDQGYDPASREAATTVTATNPGTSHTISGLDPGTEFTVRVFATKTNAFRGEYSREATGTPDPLQPGQVTGVRVTEGVESLTVSWDPVNDASGYKVQWKSGDEDYDPAGRQDTTTVTADDPGTSHTIGDLIGGTEYTVRVIAIRPADDGLPSEEKTGTPRLGQVMGVTVTPRVNSLAVSWERVEGAGGYKVQWKSGDEDYDPDSRQDTTTVTADDFGTNHIIRNLIGGAEHTVQVIATKAGDPDANGDPSRPATGTPRAPQPGQVTGVRVTEGVEFLAVSWAPVSDASGYKVQWKSGDEDYDPAGRQDTTTVTADDPGTSHTIRPLIGGTEYTVRVIAIRPADDGLPSEEETGTPRAPQTPSTPPPQPDRIEVSIAGNVVAAEGATAEFPVRLSGPSTALVTLAWITEGGTAKAGEDYVAVAAGSLTLQPGDRTGTLRVRTLDDRRVEPAETFRVRLTDATNADVDQRAASGTGTISDDDAEPARGRALRIVLAGMGRSIAADAVDVVEERFTRRPAVAQVSVGTLAPWDAAHPAVHGHDVPHGGSGHTHATGPTEADEWRSWTPGEGFRKVPAVELLSRSRFDLPLSGQDAAGATDGTLGWNLWGRGTAGGFDGKPEAGFRMDGDVVGGYVGFDYRPERDTLVGMAISHARGDADYEAEAVTAGAVDLELTSVLPYAHWKPRPDLGVWGLLGAGRGDIELKDEIGKVRTDLEMLMAAFGLRQDVTTWRGIDVDVTADAFLAELETDAATRLPKATGDAERLRLRLEGSSRREMPSGSLWTQSLEIGGRWDGGDAETGFGVEMAGGLAYAHERLGLDVEARGRVLVAHREAAFDEWGASLTVKMDPGKPGRGPWLAFAPGWGADGSRVAQMWDGTEVLRPDRGDEDETPGLSPERLELDVGYGLSTHGGMGLLTPYAGLSMAGSGEGGYKFGARLEVDHRLDLGAEGRRDEVMIYGRLVW